MCHCPPATLLPTAPAPACPPWCHGEHPAGGWTTDIGGTYKRCERHVMVDADMDYTLERFAEVDEDGAVTVGAPFLRFMGIAMALPTALKCIEVVRELIDLANGFSVAV